MAEPAARQRLPETRDSVTRRLRIGAEAMTAIVGLYPDGAPGELFLYYDKPGSLERGFLDAVALCISVGLQHGIPLDTYTSKLRGMRFGPSGFTGDQESPAEMRIKSCSSHLDLVAQWLDKRFVRPGRKAILDELTQSAQDKGLYDDLDSTEPVAAGYLRSWVGLVGE